MSLSLTLATFAPPANASDRDGDGLRDGFEMRWHLTSPDRRDSDRDGVIDSAENGDRDRLGNLGEQHFRTDPGDRDTDGDGRSDGNEDRDGDGRSNASEQDQRPIPTGLRPGLAQAPGDGSPMKGRCVSMAGSDRLAHCVLGRPLGSTSFVVMGDSHALMLLPAFRRAARSAGWRLIAMLKGGCAPVLGVRSVGQHAMDGGRSCARWRHRAVRWLQVHPPDVIVLVHLDGYALVGPGGHRLSLHARLDTWRRGMERTLEAMPSRPRILVLGDTPKNREHPVRCLRRHPTDMSACVSPRILPQRRRVEGVLRRVATAKGALHRTLYDKVCPYDPCPLVQGRVLMWRDRSHLTRTFAPHLAPSARALVREAMRSR